MRMNHLPILLGLSLCLLESTAKAQPRRPCTLGETISQADQIFIGTIQSVGMSEKDSRGAQHTRIAYKIDLSLKGDVKSGDKGFFLTSMAESANRVPDSKDSKSVQTLRRTVDVRAGSTYLLYLHAGQPVPDCSVVPEFDEASMKSVQATALPADITAAIIEVLLRRIESGTPGFWKALDTFYFSFDLAGTSDFKLRLIRDCETILKRYKDEPRSDRASEHNNDLNLARGIIEKHHSEQKDFDAAFVHAADLAAGRNYSQAKMLFSNLLFHDPGNQAVVNELAKIETQEKRALIPTCSVISDLDGDILVRSEACNMKAHQVECAQFSFPPNAKMKGITKAFLRARGTLDPQGSLVPGSIAILEPSQFPWFDSEVKAHLVSDCQFRANDRGGTSIAEFEVKFEPGWRDRLPKIRAHKIR